MQTGDDEGEGNNLILSLNPSIEVIGFFSRSGYADFEPKIPMVREKAGDHCLQSAGRIAAAGEGTFIYDRKRLIQKDGLADFSPKVDSQNHLVFSPAAWS